MQRKYAVYIGNKKVVIAAAGSVVDAGSYVRRALVPDAKALKEAMRMLDDPGVTTLILQHDDIGKVWEWFRSRYTFVQAAGGAVTDEQGRLLVMHRRGMWDLPKGKVDKGEAIPDAAVREVMEECGLQKVRITGLNGSGGQDVLAETWHTYEHKGERFLKRTDWFLMRSSSDEVLVAETKEDITEVKWMTDAEVLRMRSSTYPTLHAVIDSWREAVERK
ncbi:MAG: NUDIX domain-containing protein [Flavobacteriales bacterium]